MEIKPKTTETAADARHSMPRLVRRLRSHIAMMAPHQKEREGGKLTIASYNEIVRLREALSELVAAEEATIDKFDADEIDQLKKALDQAKAALSPNDKDTHEGQSKT